MFDRQAFTAVLARSDFCQVRVRVRNARDPEGAFCRSPVGARTFAYPFVRPEPTRTTGVKGPLITLILVGTLASDPIHWSKHPGRI
jgi:hypothetical protein